MNTKDLNKRFIELTQGYGMKKDKNAVLRSYIEEKTYEDGTAYFGIVRSDQEVSGPYSGLSLVVFPSSAEAGPAIVSLCVGSNSFDADAQLAASPWVRRLFQALINSQKANLAKLAEQQEDKDSAQSFFIKANFLDLQSAPENDFFEHTPVHEKYRKLLPAAAVIDTKKDEATSLRVLEQWVMAYAAMRGWGNKAQREKINRELFKAEPDKEQYKKIKDLLLSRHYVVLQGAPGVGKTHTARLLTQEKDWLCVFQQFTPPPHSPTSSVA